MTKTESPLFHVDYLRMYTLFSGDIDVSLLIYYITCTFETYLYTKSGRHVLDDLIYLDNL